MRSEHDDGDEEDEVEQRKGDEEPAAGEQVVGAGFAEPAPNESADRREQDRNEDDGAKPEENPMQPRRLAERHALHRHHRRLAEKTARDAAAIVGLESDQIAAQLVAVEERTNGYQSRVAEW